MEKEPYRDGRIRQRMSELERSVEVLLAELHRWERSDVPNDITPVPFMISFGILAQLACDLAVAMHDDDLGHRVLELSHKITGAMRSLHESQSG